jgi:prepilin-type N-terminal cleavage/methylation domain-containing protein
MFRFVNESPDMKPPYASANRQSGFTLLEMSIVIMMLMALLSMGIYTSRKTDEWKLARAASESLRTVHTAQRMYFADYPTALKKDLTVEKLLPYMPNNAAMPTVKSATGATLNIIVKEFPPVIDAGGGSPYDPSGSNEDSLWDVGK